MLLPTTVFVHFAGVSKLLLASQTTVYDLWLRYRKTTNKF